MICILQIHCLYLVPPIITFLAKHPSVKNYDLTSIDTIISGAAPLGKELTNTVRKSLPTVVAIGQGEGSLEPDAINKRNHAHLVQNTWISVKKRDCLPSCALEILLPLIVWSLVGCFVVLSFEFQGHVR